MKAMNVEFFTVDEELWYRTDEGDTNIFDESNVKLTNFIVNRIRELFPESFKALSLLYKSSSGSHGYYMFLIARRFLKCNLGDLDTTLYDIGKEGKLNFEKVKCPLRGECKLEGIVCCPEIITSITEAEKRVIKLLYEGNNMDYIADSLFISPNTVKNHIKSVYKKLGIHSKSELIKYIHDNNMFT